MLYKVLSEDGSACNGGTGKWHLPTQNADGTWTPGEWMPKLTGRLEPCQHGYHLCEDAQLFGWLGPAIFEAEYKYKRAHDDNKVIVRQARLLRRMAWDDRIARLLACDCADHVLPIFEAKYPGDDRPRNAIETSRRYAEGNATKEELAAAGDAAWAASWDAARDAARDAAWAARDASWDASWDAARDAARAAAWDAAWAAWDAAWDAARDAGAAARDAAGAAASGKERLWQYQRLSEYLEGRHD